jgi:diguanylate cyclase (GGDEF)-like protein/PAS domain S-box-containing protein
VNERANSLPGAAVDPEPGYAGRTRYTQLEYEAVLANASIGIAFTRDRKFFLCNPKFAEMFGWGQGELIGQSGEVIYASAESYQALGQIAVPVLSGGRQLDLEWEMRRKDGSTFLARMIAKAIDPENPRQGTVWIVEDITARKRAADEVNRLLREQDAIFETASIGIAFVRERRILRCNRRFEEIFGYAAGEMANAPTRVVYADEEAFLKVGQAYEQLARGLAHSENVPARRKDGGRFWVRLTGRAADPADPMQGSVWTAEDITEQKRSEEEMQRMVLEQQALLNNVVIGICFVHQGRVLRCNRRLEELFGYSPGELLGGSTRFAFFTDDEFESATRNERELGEGRAFAREQFLRRKDGSGFWCRLSGRAVESGRVEGGSVWLFEDITERRRADEAVQRLLREQNAILENVLIGIVFLKERRILRCNQRFEEIFGYAQGELLNQSTRVLFLNDADFEAGAAPYPQLWAGETYRVERRHVRKDGGVIWCSVSGRAVNPSDPAQGVVVLFEDISERRDSRKRIKRALAEQELILSNATVGIGFVRGRMLRRANPRLAEMTGRRVEDLVGQSTAILFASEEEWNEASQRAHQSTEPGNTHEAEVRFKRADGSSFLCRTVGRRIDSGAAEQEWIWSCEDVTAQHALREGLVRSRDELEQLVSERTAELQAANRKLESEIGERVQAENLARHLADHDILTGLPNRRILEDRLTQALALSQRNRKQTAVMFVDLDRFKHINDSLGHAVGDALLKEVAGRLSGQLRDGDTICRIGGDEFVVVLPEVKRAADPANVAQKIIENLSMPFLIEGRELTITPSLGISVYPDDGRDAETLIRNADAAMYHAKEMGRANYQFFTEQMNLTASRRIALEGELRRAQRNDELRVFYQPIAEIGTRSAVSREALLRWAHPARGLVVAGEFLVVAEDIGLIHRIGERVLQSVCAWMMGLEQARRIPVSVNLSMRQFNDPRLIELVGRVLKDTGLPAGLLGFEIKESTLMDQTGHTLAMLRKLKDLGVTLSVDDFGTGQSSLAFLKRFALDRVKIDRSFIADVPGNADDCAVVAAIVGLAHHMKLQVVAAGVEREEQLALLADYGCDLVQGYLIGEPRDADGASGA